MKRIAAAPEVPPAPPRLEPSAWTHALPVVFLLLWSSGFIACKAGLYHAEPFTYLLYRFAAASALLALVGLAMRAPWPTAPRRIVHLIIAGVLIHATYLGPNFFGASRGFPVGITALIGALQPLLTALLASRFFDERVSGAQWTGLAVGLAGILMVLSDKLAFDWDRSLELVLVLAGITSLTLGTLYQKHFCGWMDLRTGSALQLGAAAVVMLGGALAFESFRVEWQPAFVASLSSLVLISVVTYTIMHVLFLRGAASRVASLFYLVPPITSTILYLFFGENLGALALAGIAVTVLGVVVATRRPSITRL